MKKKNSHKFDNFFKTNSVKNLKNGNGYVKKLKWSKITVLTLSRVQI